jgi:uncharacterized membrane protein
MVTRFLRHLLSTPLRLCSAFPAASLERIEREIAQAERENHAEIRFAVEGALDILPLLRGQSARERAIEVFSDLRVWDTEGNNGVLIYLLLADRDVEIVADRGVSRIDDWGRICREMEARLARGRYEEAVVEGIRSIAAVLARGAPAREAPRERMPDRPVLIS